MFDFDEKQLIKRTKQREADAFNPLVIKYQPRIYAFISQQIKDPETAKDLTQETWLKALRVINRFRGDSAFASWLYRIAENVCIDYFRKQRKAYDIEPLHTVKQIATRLNRSEGTIKSHLRNARLQLQEYLTPYLKNQHIPWLS